MNEIGPKQNTVLSEIDLKLAAQLREFTDGNWDFPCPADGVIDNHTPRLEISEIIEQVDIYTVKTGHSK